MVEYNRRIDEQIAAVLDRNGRVTCHDLSGLDPAHAAESLRRYVEVHSTETALEFDGSLLTRRAPVRVARETEPSVHEVLSPVDQVLAAPTSKALLDSAPAGTPVSRSMWLLPLLLGLPGGLIASAVVRDRNERVARQLLMVGVAVQVASLCAAASLRPLFGAVVQRSGIGLSQSAKTWPASATGKPAFYYFGTAG